MRQWLISMLNLDIKCLIMFFSYKKLPIEDGKQFENMMSNDNFKRKVKIIHEIG